MVLHAAQPFLPIKRHEISHVQRAKHGPSQHRQGWPWPGRHGCLASVHVCVRYRCDGRSLPTLVLHAGDYRAIRTPAKEMAITVNDKSAAVFRQHLTLEKVNRAARRAASPGEQAARELIVLELYRQGEASSGKAAALLGMERGEFIRYASARGIPYLQLSGEELRREAEDSQAP